MPQLIVSTSSKPAGELNAALAALIDARRLRRSRPLAFDGGGNPTQVVATTELEGGDDDVDADLGYHLWALREMSRQDHLAFDIELAPDGGVLHLIEGSFGEDNATIGELIAAARLDHAEADRSYRFELRIMVPPELHPDVLGGLLEPVRTALPNQPLPMIRTTPASVELTFVILDREQLAIVIATLGTAWRRLPSRPQAWAELDGVGDARLERAVTRPEDWADLERAARARDGDTTTARSTSIELPAPIALGWYPHVAELLGREELRWLDRRGRPLALTVDGHLVELAEHRVALVDRVEHGEPTRAELVLGRDGRPDVHRNIQDKDTLDLALAPAPDGHQRRMHLLTSSFVVVTDSTGDALGGSSRVRVLGGRTAESPAFRNVSAIAACGASNELMLACESRGHQRLVTVSLGLMGWTVTDVWGDAWTAVDLAVVSVEELAIVLALGRRTRVIVIGRAYHDDRITIDIPCSHPALVHASGAQLWLTGTRDDGDGIRHDLVRIDTTTGEIAVGTAGLPSAGWGRLVPATHDGRRWVLTYADRGVYATERDRPPWPVIATSRAKIDAAAIARCGTIAASDGGRLHLVRDRDFRHVVTLDEAAPASALRWWPAPTPA